MELRIVEAFFDMVSQRQVLVVLFSNGLIVYFHIIIDSLLVAQMIVILHFTV